MYEMLQVSIMKVFLLIFTLKGDEHTNLVLAWHGGAVESVCHKIAEGNFRMSGGDVKKIDAGYFGNGIYFTQYPNYGDFYTRQKKAQKRQTEEMPLLLSWVLMGNVYPVCSQA